MNEYSGDVHPVVFLRWSTEASFHLAIEKKAFSQAGMAIYAFFQVWSESYAVLVSIPPLF